MPADIDLMYVERIVKQYTTMVFRIAYNNVKIVEEAEDIVQDVFVKFMRAKNFESDEHVKAWLIRVTINMCKNYHLLFRNSKTVPLDENISCISAQPQGVHEEFQGIYEELRKLKVNYRNVLYLYYFEGYTIPEIAKILKKSTGTISTWLSRAKKNFRPILAERLYRGEFE